MNFMEAMAAVAEGRKVQRVSISRSNERIKGPVLYLQASTGVMFDDSGKPSMVRFLCCTMHGPNVPYGVSKEDETGYWETVR